MLFCYQMKMFYLWSLRHIIVLILSHAVSFLHPKLKCTSCSPYAFSVLKTLLHSHCLFVVLFFFSPFCPFTLILNVLFKMPHKSKGSSSCFVPNCNRRHRLSRAMWKVYFIWIFFNQSSSLSSETRKMGKRRGRLQVSTLRSGLLAVAQPVKREEELSLFCLFLECCIYPVWGSESCSMQ